jgi:D-arabinose 1-dehydrogenase-like Zn-dependent alcohol dehydrogenase
MACKDETCDFKPTTLHRRSMGDDDIEIAMKYCGCCHSDLHSAAGHLKGALGPPQYPHVPGHELSGIVARIGSNVKTFKVGDYVGVGCMVDSCGGCKHCLAGNEQKCPTQTGTYQGTNTHGRAAVWPPKSKTLGGYTKTMIVHWKFAILIPKTFPLEMAGPVMCAGEGIQYYLRYLYSSIIIIIYLYYMITIQSP